MPQSAKALLDYLSGQLTALYSPTEARSIAYWLIEQVAGLSRTAIVAGQPLPSTQPDWDALLARLLRAEPIQYVLGETTFRGLNMAVSPAVLIPRPETEELVELVIEAAAGLSRPVRVLDIGTGSGCIAVSLAAALPQSQVRAWDVSAEALAVARHNAARNGVDVIFEEIDFLSENFRHNYPETFDVVVSNPPYVTLHERTHMHSNVVEHEPHLALFVPDSDPLVFYRAIAAFCRAQLRAEGLCLVEINEQFGPQTAELFVNQGFRAEVLRDFHGKDRFVNAFKIT